MGLYSYTSAHTEAFAEVRVVPHGWAFAGHFQQFVVVLYGNIPAIDLGMEHFEAKAH